MSLGSLLTTKGEDSEEDEDTEYFDAMEDSTSFITVITEPKEDRWARGWAATWKEPLPAQPRRPVLVLHLFFALGVFFKSCSRWYFCLDWFCSSLNQKYPNRVCIGISF